ncbi:MAG: hypothetical protein ABR555_05060 [Pyrinomonadaceae bacterium]
MTIDKSKIKTQDELDEPAPMDQVEERVEAEMKELQDAAKRDVAEGLSEDNFTPRPKLSQQQPE